MWPLFFAAAATSEAAATDPSQTPAGQLEGSESRHGGSENICRSMPLAFILDRLCGVSNRTSADL